MNICFIYSLSQARRVIPNAICLEKNKESRRKQLEWNDMTCKGPI